MDGQQPNTNRDPVKKSTRFIRTIPCLNMTLRYDLSTTPTALNQTAFQSVRSSCCVASVSRWRTIRNLASPSHPVRSLPLKSGMKPSSCAGTTDSFTMVESAAHTIASLFRKARKHVNPLNIQHLALVGHALTTDFPSLARILPTQLIILPLPVLGWLSIAQFAQGFQEKAPSEQPLPLLENHIS